MKKISKSKIMFQDHHIGQGGELNLITLNFGLKLKIEFMKDLIIKKKRKVDKRNTLSLKKDLFKLKPVRFCKILFSSELSNIPNAS